MKTYYKNFKSGDTELFNSLVCKETRTVIPKDETNRLYREVLKLVERGLAEIMDYVEPAPVHYPISWENIKSARNELLKETDWVGLSDVNVSNKQAWLDYRQSLRDIPQNFANSEDVVWPTKP